MSTNHPRILDPRALHAAAVAYDESLRALNDETVAGHAFSLRRELAGHILESAFHGEREPKELSRHALARMARAA